MNRQEFLKVYHQLKSDIVEREDNQFADVSGELATVETFDEYTYNEDKESITTPEDYCDNEYILDFYHESHPRDCHDYKDCLVVIYYRSNHVTTRLDFYNNEVEVAPYDLQASWQTEYYTADSEGVLTQVDVSKWNGWRV